MENKHSPWLLFDGPLRAVIMKTCLNSKFKNKQTKSTTKKPQSSTEQILCFVDHPVLSRISLVFCRFSYLAEVICIFTLDGQTSFHIFSASSQMNPNYLSQCIIKLFICLSLTTNVTVSGCSSQAIMFKHTHKIIHSLVVVFKLLIAYCTAILIRLLVAETEQMDL